MHDVDALLEAARDLANDATPLDADRDLPPGRVAILMAAQTLATLDLAAYVGRLVDAVKERP